nr:MAG TPA_asm: hypothetical protein [Caudoviricetes sp.]DAX12456.1 MAG TPA: hypothetical protein [Caudoviricetes sp.]
MSETEFSKNFFCRETLPDPESRCFSPMDYSPSAVSTSSVSIKIP